MRTTPDNLDRRATLIKQLKEAQHNLMNVIFAIIQEAVPAESLSVRDFRAKYPDDVLVDQINGECDCVRVCVLLTGRKKRRKIYIYIYIYIYNYIII